MDSLPFLARTLGAQPRWCPDAHGGRQSPASARGERDRLVRTARRCKTSAPILEEEALRQLCHASLLEDELLEEELVPMRRQRRSKTATSALSQLTTPTSMSSSRPISACSSPSARDAAEDLADLAVCTPPILHWRKGAPIGSGSYGCVYRAQDCQSGHIFAIKQAAVEEGNEDDRRFLECLTLELEICSSLRHPNIVSCLGHERLDNSLYIFLEYLPGGSMASVLREFGSLCGSLLRKATRGALQGLNYLHTHIPPVVHRDIKAANLLVDLSFRVKLADFGCSKRGAETQSFTTMGSVPWMAPEVITQLHGHGRKADIWSLGCTVLEMATAEKPWGNSAFENIAAAITRIGMSKDLPPIPEMVSEAGRDFVKLCVRRSPEERPLAKHLLEHHLVSH